MLGECSLVLGMEWETGKPEGGCQEYYQNSVLFSQFLLTLCYTNYFIPYLLFFLTISDHQQEQDVELERSPTERVKRIPVTDRNR